MSSIRLRRGKRCSAFISVSRPATVAPLCVPFDVPINFVSYSFDLPTNLLQLADDIRVIIVVLTSKLIDQSDNYRKRSSHDRNDD